MSTQVASNTQNQTPDENTGDTGVALTAKEFKEELGRLVEEFDNVLELNSKIAVLQKGKTYEMPDGRKIGRREFKQARSQFVNELRNLSKLYGQAKKPRKRSGARRPGTGFRIPILVSDQLRAFFSEANLGPVDPRDPKSSALKDELLLLTQNGVTSAALLTPLFSIYAIVNKLTEKSSSNHTNPKDLRSPCHSIEDMNHQMLGADDLMYKHFSSTFDLLRSRGAHTTEHGTEIPAFDPQNFKYASFQSLVSLNRRTKDGKLKRKVNGNATEEINPAGPALSADEVAYLENEKVKEELEREQKRVSDTLAIYRDMNKPTQKELRKGKRKTTAPAPVAKPAASGKSAKK